MNEVQAIEAPGQRGLKESEHQVIQWKPRFHLHGTLNGRALGHAAGFQWFTEIAYTLTRVETM
jgi:hypothetical protein